MDVLLILTIISAVALVLFFFKGQNAVWGGATIGAIIGLVAGAITGGVVAELMGMMSDKMKRT